ncbi:hypothetical protein TELCIR_19118, partial [Teladorsagia circumcincta]
LMREQGRSASEILAHARKSARKQRCRFESSLRLPELPEMVFPNNTLTIEFTKFAGSSINFNALDALKMVSPDVLPDVQ